MSASRLSYVTIDVNELSKGVDFWSQALVAESDPAFAGSSGFRRLILPGHQIQILLQLVPEPKTAKTRMHLDLAAQDVVAEVARLEKLGAKIVRPPGGDGFKFGVLEDPFGNEFCVLPEQ